MCSFLNIHTLFPLCSCIFLLTQLLLRPKRFCFVSENLSFHVSKVKWWSGRSAVADLTLCKDSFPLDMSWWFPGHKSCSEPTVTVCDVQLSPDSTRKRAKCPCPAVNPAVRWTDGTLSWGEGVHLSLTRALRLQVPDSRSQTPGPRLQVPDWLQVPDSRSQTPGPWLQVPDSRSQTLGLRLQVPDSRSQTPGPRLQVPDSRSQTPGPRLQVPDSRSQTPGPDRSQTPGPWLQVPDSRSPGEKPFWSAVKPLHEHQLTPSQRWPPRPPFPHVPQHKYVLSFRADSTTQRGGGGLNLKFPQNNFVPRWFPASNWSHVHQSGLEGTAFLCSTFYGGVGRDPRKKTLEWI